MKEILPMNNFIHLMHKTPRLVFALFSNAPFRMGCWLISFALLFGSASFAQPPQKMSYQAVIRNSSNALVVSQQVGMRISILQGGANGNAVFVETQTATTNANGLVSIEVGGGTVLSGNFASINWANGPFFIKTETDPNGGNAYSMVGTSQLLSVPYALHAGSAASAANGIPSGGASGQVLTICNGVPTWTTGGQCPTNGSGNTACGSTGVHNPALTYGSMSDQDGNVYKTIVIGTQEWMAENLKASHYRNGDPIPIAVSNADWNTTNGSACWYNNDSASYHCPYGKLYNWYAVSDQRNLCPQNWHVPTEHELNRLVKFLDALADTNCLTCSQSSTAGGKLKSSGNQYWLSPNLDANNSTGFSMLPAGFRSSTGFNGMGNYGQIWSAFQANTFNGWLRETTYDMGILFRYFYPMSNGFPVRCIKD
jgi:uncharacterized protein (TIGR02145 family)